MASRDSRLSLTDPSALAERLYGVRAKAQDLPSERDQKVLLESESGERFVLKLANITELREVLEAECAVMRHLEPGGLTPRLIPTAKHHAVRDLYELAKRTVAAVYLEAALRDGFNHRNWTRSPSTFASIERYATNAVLLRFIPFFLSDRLHPLL